MHELAQRLLRHIRRQELLLPGERVGVAVSGGIDSVTLLHLLAELRHELGIVLAVVHFHHQLRGADADTDSEFVQNLAREHKLDFHSDTADVSQFAASEHMSVEAAAREMRYAYFRHLLGENASADDPQSARVLNKIATGHTLDDQAETVLMRVIRGTGLRGLGAIYPRVMVEDDSGEACGEIIRPLLTTRRAELDRYLREMGKKWREDATNTEAKFTRNRVRHQLLPLLERDFNPSITENLADLSEIARAEEDFWENEAAGWHGTFIHWFEPEWLVAWQRKQGARALVQIAGATKGCAPSDAEVRARIENASWLIMNASLNAMWLLAESLAVQRRIIKSVGEQARIPLEFKHIAEILEFAADEKSSGKELSLPLGWKLCSRSGELLWVTPNLANAQSGSAQTEFQDYEYELAVPGQVLVAEADVRIEARRIAAGEERAAYNPDDLLDVNAILGTLKVRNWRAGDRFWPAHTKSPKKIKELLQERHVPLAERKLWPVMVTGEEIIWVRGFPVPAKLQAKAGKDAIAIVAERVGD